MDHTVPETYRRDGVTVPIEHGNQTFFVTYNFRETDGQIYECFSAITQEFKEGSDFYVLLSDSCIAVSKLIEAGYSFAQLTRCFGENRAPGAERGPPASILGAIAAKAVELSRD